MSNDDARPITAIALDGRVELKEAVERLGWREVRRYAYGAVLEREGQGRLYIYRFGAVVQEDTELLEHTVLRRVEEATGRRSIPSTEETYFLKVDPEHAGARPRVGWDRVIIRSDDPEVTAAIALLMGQSAALERYEAASDKVLSEILPATRKLAENGRLPRSNPRAIQRIGKLATDRLELASLFYLLDRPEETWEHPEVAAMYEALFNNLELAERHEATLHRLEAAEKVTDLTITLWLGHLSNRLEWTIVLLIILEIALALLKRG